MGRWSGGMLLRVGRLGVDSSLDSSGREKGGGLLFCFVFQRWFLIDR